MTIFKEVGWYWIQDLELKVQIVDWIDKEIYNEEYEREYEILCFIGNDFNQFLEIYGKARE